MWVFAGLATGPYPEHDRNRVPPAKYPGDAIGIEVRRAFAGDGGHDFRKGGRVRASVGGRALRPVWESRRVIVDSYDAGARSSAESVSWDVRYRSGVFKV